MRIVRKSSSKPKRSKLEERLFRAWENPPPGPWEPTVSTTRNLMPEREFKFHPTRRWLFDFAWPALKVAVEVQGGGFVRGKHGRGAGQQNDFDKLNEAQRLGWVVIQFGSTHLSRHRKCRQAVIYINQILKDRLDAQAHTISYRLPHTIEEIRRAKTLHNDTFEQARPRCPSPPKPVRRPRSRMV